MSNFDTIDFFTDGSLVPDPHPYFDYLRSQNPVLPLPHHGVVAVTGYEEATEVYKDTETFSNIVALGGPFPPLPFQPEGDDISAQIDQHRSYFPMYEHMVTMCSNIGKELRCWSIWPLMSSASGWKGSGGNGPPSATMLENVSGSL